MNKEQVWEDMGAALARQGKPLRPLEPGEEKTPERLALEKGYAAAKKSRARPRKWQAPRRAWLDSAPDGTPRGKKER